MSKDEAKSEKPAKAAEKKPAVDKQVSLLVGKRRRAGQHARRLRHAIKHSAKRHPVRVKRIERELAYTLGQTPRPPFSYRRKSKQPETKQDTLENPQ